MMLFVDGHLAVLLQTAARVTGSIVMWSRNASQIAVAEILSWQANRDGPSLYTVFLHLSHLFINHLFA